MGTDWMQGRRGRGRGGRLDRLSRWDIVHSTSLVPRAKNQWDGTQGARGYLTRREDVGSEAVRRDALQGTEGCKVLLKYPHPRRERARRR